MDITPIIKLLTSVILGGIIGFEREKLHKPAGLRTMMLVALGSTLATIISVDYFNSDPARVAAAILTGIGFLGAGAIISSKNNIHGITTAATVWVTAAVGITVGVGYYFIAIVSSVLIYLILIFWKIEQKTLK